MARSFHIDEYIEDNEAVTIVDNTPLIPILSANPIRKEVHTRCAFSLEQGEKYFKELVRQGILDRGNILSNFWTRKFIQARRIYIYYTNEFQSNFQLPKTN